MSAAMSNRSSAIWSRRDPHDPRAASQGSRSEGRAHGAEERVLDALGRRGRQRQRRATVSAKSCASGELDDREIEIEVRIRFGACRRSTFPGCPGAQMGMINLNDMLGKAFGGRTKPRRMSVAESYDVLIDEEGDKLVDEDKIVREAIDDVEQNGIVFLDELDKICAQSERHGADVSREGVQRDLLPLIEGTTVSTKHGAVENRSYLFIASGAFHVAKPSDLLPELQGRCQSGSSCRRCPRKISGASSASRRTA